MNHTPKFETKYAVIVSCFYPMMSKICPAGGPNIAMKYVGVDIDSDLGAETAKTSVRQPQACMRNPLMARFFSWWDQPDEGG